jgi:hypothetical protein
MIRLTKTYNIDTQKERERINNSFKKERETKLKLLELMDAIEACDWTRCHSLLISKWWQGYDKKQECSRLEFIGGVDTVPEYLFGAYYSYLDLIKDMLTYPNLVCEPNVTLEEIKS